MQCNNIFFYAKKYVKKVFFLHFFSPLSFFVFSSTPQTELSGHKVNYADEKTKTVKFSDQLTEKREKVLVSLFGRFSYVNLDIQDQYVSVIVGTLRSEDRKIVEERPSPRVIVNKKIK